MSAISKSLGRTVKTNIILYTTDNQGRDGYITYNNGGFWKDNIKQIRIKSSFPRYINNTFHSLHRDVPSFNYYSDGRGRDTYVLKDNAGLTKEFHSLANGQILSKYLRKNNGFSFNQKLNNHKLFLTPSDKENYLKNYQIQKNVVSRLYNQCLEKFKNKMKVESSPFEDSFNSLKMKDNYLSKIKRKKLLKYAINAKINQNLKFKLNKTDNYFFNSNKNQETTFGNLKNNYFINYKVNKYDKGNNSLKNIDVKNTFNCLSSGNWNPLISKYDNINDYSYSNKKMNTLSNVINSKKKIIEKNKTNDSFLDEIKRNKTMKIETFKERPKSYRKLFQKKQIFNNYKPFLVDDF